MSDKLLSVKDLKIHFQTYRGIVHAVNGVDFELDSEETLGIVGETGCGKSVTALSILGLIPRGGKIVEGEIRFEGEDLSKKKEEEMHNIRGKKISMIFQDPMTSLNPVFRVGSQIAETIMLHQDLSKKEAWDKSAKLLKLVGIPTAEKRIKDYPHEFSGGMRQRAMIAMALSCHPKLLIADEPTTALDVTVQAQILHLMKELRKEFKSSILLITHNLGVIAEMCDRVAVMYCGQIMESAFVKDIFYSPKHPYTVGLLRAIPGTTQRKTHLQSIAGMIPDLTNPPEGCKFHPRCPRARDACREETPRLAEVDEKHFVACFQAS